MKSQKRLSAPRATSAAASRTPRTRPGPAHASAAGSPPRPKARTAPKPSAPAKAKSSPATSATAARPKATRVATKVTQKPTTRTRKPKSASESGAHARRKTANRKTPPLPASRRKESKATVPNRIPNPPADPLLRPNPSPVGPAVHATPAVPSSPPEGAPVATPIVSSGHTPEPPDRRKPDPRRTPEFPPVLLAGDFPAPGLWDALETRPHPATGALPQPTAPPSASRTVASAPSTFPPTFPPSIQIWLQARDPYCLVVFWDASAGDLDRFADAQGGGGWRLQVTGGHLPDRRVLDDALSTSLDHRFVAVPDPGCAYFAEIGFRTVDGSWISVARSAALSTPVAGPGPLPPMPAALLREDAAVGRPLGPDPAVHFIPTPPSRRPGKSRSRNPKGSGAPAAGSTPPIARDHGNSADLLFALALEDDASPAVLSSSEWARRTRREPRESASNAGRTGPHPDSAAWIAPGAEGSSGHRLQPESPVPPPEFWFEINAELIVYGRTERDANVTVGGRPIPLRPDGSFRFQFTLPDGEYEMPVVAVNARNDDGRAALLEFSRHTETTGTVGTHPQDPSLNPPPVVEQRASDQFSVISERGD